MKIVITGGHLSPAFAVIEKLKKENLLFIGRKHALTGDKALSLEYQLCQKLGISFEEIKTARLQRHSFTKSFFTFFNLPVGFFQAVKILKNNRPDVVLGFGGYVSLPVIFAAKKLNIPVVIHEQTLEAGVANKIAARIANKVCISWESSMKFFPKLKIILTGNPIRAELFSFDSGKENLFNFKNNSLPVLYITGGSLGAHALNVLVENALPELLKFANVIHQTGDSKKYSDFDRLSKNALANYSVQKFFSSKELSAIFNKVSLVISRSGINTITELINFKKPCFLIPLPTGQKNEQLKNALFCKKLGLAEVGIQSKLDAQKIIQAIKFMLGNLSKYKISNKTEGMTNKDAAEKIVEVIKNVARNRSS
jgi:UDP-N-acetylglucosamine--N-acetylmuramyl-(pentapeptide) pyrophosphoryl-undecaprenol N-acetylglucosamine transferase